MFLTYFPRTDSLTTKKHGHRHGYDTDTSTEYDNFLKSGTRGHGDMTLEYAYQ